MSQAFQGRCVVVHGGSGAIGSAVARAFAREGAQVFITGRNRTRLDAAVRAIALAGGSAEAAVVDGLDEQAMLRHASEVAERAGGIDVALNAIGILHVQGTPLSALSLEDFFLPVHAYTRSTFLTAKAVSPHMAKRGGGVILSVSTPASRLPGPGYLGHAVACAGVEALSRHMAGELAAFNIRTVCIRSHAIPEAALGGSHAYEVFRPVAESMGITVEQMLSGNPPGLLVKHLPSLDQMAATALFAASQGAGAMTGAVLNLSGGITLD
ncbi:SDR family NAD(P)-dependent oxidoreductase [Variovorax sp. Root411]|uniref:SDR family NAD(P)-dependent oxidoreductase n=1 Tax=Variovorax sp. Root411 TaxID=1736530 RepID=UPI0006FD3A71|nr:SDR family oxidoreductase [Variovorax sp. Root411]KQW64726.1 short-chain dehydrogenase [Variovorax sp. Root411]